MIRARRRTSVAFAVLLATLPERGVVAQDAPGSEDLAQTVARIETMIVDVKAMVSEQDRRLEDLYAQREAAPEGPRRAALDQLIDTMTLQLDKTEALQVTLDAQAKAFRQALSVAEPPVGDAAQPMKDGASDK